jgi:hypothetical protein
MKLKLLADLLLARVKTGKEEIQLRLIGNEAFDFIRLSGWTQQISAERLLRMPIK